MIMRSVEESIKPIIFAVKTEGDSAVARFARQFDKAPVEADALAARIEGNGGRAGAWLADIGERDAVRAMVDGVLERFGRIDILVLNASVRNECAFLDLPYEDWRRVMTTTLDGAYHCSQACLPSMIATGGGSIVTLGGMTALSGAKKRVHGSVGKHGLWGMTRALAKELGEHRINVNCVAPGQMDTARAADRSERAPVTNVPMGRRSTPEEVAGIVRYLCTPAGRMISGQLIYVDGGQQMF
jgi:3-oxoacyl-[acyl-carrier protein] reductase